MKSSVVDKNEFAFIEGKIEGLSPEKLKTQKFLFESFEDNLDIYDLVLNEHTSKRIKIPVVNESECDQRLKRGQTLGRSTLLEENTVSLNCLPFNNI